MEDATPQKRQAKSIPIPFFENEWIGLICLLSSLAAWMELIGGALGSFVVGYRRLAAIMLRKRETSAPTIQGWVIEKLNCLNGMRTNQSFHFTWGERANASRCKPKQHQQIKWIFMGMKFIDLWFVWWGAATQQLINSSFHLINQQHKDKKLSFVGLVGWIDCGLNWWKKSKGWWGQLVSLLACCRAAAAAHNQPKRQLTWPPAQTPLGLPRRTPSFIHKFMNCGGQLRKLLL